MLFHLSGIIGLLVSLCAPVFFIFIACRRCHFLLDSFQSLNERLIASFIGSLIVNTALVPVLVLLGLYTPLGLFAGYLVLFAVGAALCYGRGAARDEGVEVPLPLSLGFALATLVVFIGFVWVVWPQLGSGFTAYDSIVSWNRWALSWADGHIPEYLWRYPQLLPIIMSIVYKIQGNEIQYYPALAAPFFSIFLLLAFVGWSHRQPVAGMTAAALFLYLLAHFGVAGGNGMADAPLAVLIGFSALGLLRMTEETAVPRIGGWLILAVGAAALAALMKPGGVLILVATAAIIQFLRNDLKTRLPRRLLVGPILVAFAAVAAVYAYLHWRVYIGADFDRTLIQMADLHGGRTLWQRFLHANNLLAGAFGLWPMRALWAGALLAAVFDRRWRIILGVMVLPYFLFWALFWSYDERNGTHVLPALCLGVGVAAQRLVGLLQSKLSPRTMSSPSFSVSPRLAVAAAVAVPMVLAAILGWRYPQEALADAHYRHMMSVGPAPEVTERVRVFRDAHPMEGRLITDYQILQFLPDFKKHEVFYASFRELGLVSHILEQAGAGYVLLVWPAVVGPEVVAYFDRLSELGAVRFIQREPALWVFYYDGSNVKDMRQGTGSVAP